MLYDIFVYVSDFCITFFVDCVFILYFLITHFFISFVFAMVAFDWVNLSSVAYTKTTKISLRNKISIVLCGMILISNIGFLVRSDVTSTTLNAIRNPFTNHLHLSDTETRNAK